MPTRVSPKDTNSAKRRTKKAKQKVTPGPVLELTEDIRRRFAELAEPRHPDDDECPACHGAVGFGKVPLGQSRIRYVCVPCVMTLLHHAYTPDKMTWGMLRLPSLREYLSHPDRATLHLMLNKSTTH